MIDRETDYDRQGEARYLAYKLGVETKKLAPWQISQHLAELAYQRRARQLGVSESLFQDPVKAAQFLLQRKDEVIFPGKTDIKTIVSFLKETAIEELSLSDFPFFLQATERKGELRRLAGNPSLIRSRNFFGNELAKTHERITKLLHQQDEEELNREQQFLPEDEARIVSRQLARAYFVGAYKFSRSKVKPDWYWPVTWCSDPTFGDAKRIENLLASWQNPTDKPTTYLAFCDLSDIYIAWLEAKRQHMVFTQSTLEFARPIYNRKHPNWGQPARGIKKGGLVIVGKPTT